MQQVRFCPSQGCQQVRHRWKRRYLVAGAGGSWLFQQGRDTEGNGPDVEEQTVSKQYHICDLMGSQEPQADRRLVPT